MRIHLWPITSKVSYTSEAWSWYEGSSIGNSGEGENDGSCPVEEAEVNDDTDSTGNFAPRGASKFQARIRNRLPKPRDAKSSRQLAALSRLYDACAVCSRLSVPLVWQS